MVSTGISTGVVSSGVASTGVVCAGVVSVGFPTGVVASVVASVVSESLKMFAQDAVESKSAAIKDTTMRSLKILFIFHPPKMNVVLPNITS